MSDRVKQANKELNNARVQVTKPTTAIVDKKKKKKSEKEKEEKKKKMEKERCDKLIQRFCLKKAQRQARQAKDSKQRYDHWQRQA